MNPTLFSATRFLFRHVGNYWPTLFAYWGTYLWGRTYRLPWRPWEEAIMASARREFCVIEKKNIAIYHWGQGQQTILLLPGWNSRASHFRNYIETLTAAGYSVIGVDPVGHGHSSGKWTNVRQYLVLIASISKKYGPFYAVIGHSFGAFCIPYALKHHKIADKAVLLSSPSHLKWLFQRLTKTLDAPPAVCTKMQRRIEHILGQDCWKKYSVGEHASQLAHVPTLIVHDENDLGVPLAQGKANHASWPGSQLLVTKRLGHHRVLRHTLAITEVVNFIREK